MTSAFAAVTALDVVVLLGAMALTAVVVAATVRRSERRHARDSVVAAADRAGVSHPPDPDDLAAAVAIVERALGERRGSAENERSMSLLFKDALDGLPQGVLIIDDTGEVVERNAAAEAFVAARHSDALVEAAIAELVSGALEGLPDRRELELFGPPRRVVVVDVAPILTSSGNAAVALIDDITEHRRLEAVRRDFVANISHELKTPVGAIGLLAETLLGEDDPEVAARLAGRIQSESLRVGRTIDDLLELSRIETSSVNQPAQVAIVGIIGEAVSRIQPAAEQAGISIDAAGVDPTVEVRGDGRQLTSAISNLLDNAVKYSDAGSTVEIGARLGDDGQVAVSVSDRGIGIPARDIERVFERFYRVDQGRSRQTGGTGLGLAIVRHVAANHEGSVEVASRLGEGSTFTLRLPASHFPESTRTNETELVR